MTLYASDYLDHYLTLLGWIVHNGIWSVLVSSGVFAIPFLAIILDEWLKSRTEGADEGNKGVLSALRIENQVWAAIVVVMFAGIPFIDVDLNALRFDESRSEQCQVTVPLPADTGWSQSFTTLNDQSAQLPVWWAFMHTLSRAVSAAALAAIPCGTDLRQLRMEVNATRVNSPLLAQEVADFSLACYGPARAKLFMSRPALDETQQHDVSWIGSLYFTNTPGYYDSYLDRLKGNKVIFANTKSKPVRSVPILDELAKEIRQHWQTHGPFTNCLGVFRIVLLSTSIKLPRGQASHVLRHTFASHFIMNGGHIVTLQHILGHASLSMTMRYAHLSKEHLNEAVRLNPLTKN